MRYAIQLIEQVIKGETVAVIHRSQFAERLTRDIELALAPTNSWQVSQEADGRLRWTAVADQSRMHEQVTGFWRHFKSGLFGLFPMGKFSELSVITL